MSSEFQNRLRQNLEHEAPAEHPTPDVLNAYVEQALPAAEQKAVLDHLSHCAECREVVYLASVASEAPAATVVRPSASHRIRWWSWAIPLAAVLVIGTTVFLSRLDHLNQTAPFTQARSEAPLAPAPAPQPASPAKTAALDKVAPPAQKKEEKPARKAAPPPSYSRPVPQTQRQNEPVQANPVTEQRIQNLIALSSRDKSAAPTALAAKVAPPPPAAAPSFAPQASNETVEVTESAAQSVVTDDKELPKDAAGRDSESRAYSVNSPALYRTHKAVVMNAWRVAGNYELQHAINGTWQTVVPAAGAKLLTVSSFGADVWAGGNELALFHSNDAGVTWSRQTIHGAKPGDILHIEFSSPTNGLVKTSAGEAFTTRDGGSTWTGLSANAKP